MQNLYDEVGILDRRCYDEFALSEDILMEHAARGMAEFIKARFQKASSILIVTGSGNNGGDGMVLARQLFKEYEIELYLAKEPKSEMAKIQFERAKKVGITPVSELKSGYDIIVDAVLGSGFSGSLNDSLRRLFQKLNTLKGYKIACDVPSGLSPSGICDADTFKADTTCTMGALKKSLYLDQAKDFVGEIVVCDLGVAREIYETPSNWKLLELDDTKLPHRNTQNTHKGSFGHTAVIAGEKPGAAVLCALGTLRIGSGLVSVVECQNHTIPHELMRSEHLPKNTTTIAIGMGLGEVYSDSDIAEFIQNDIPTVADADIIYTKHIHTLLQKNALVLTPHPKEFTQLLKTTNIADISIKELQEKRFFYVELFCKHYPNVTLLLKGANVIVAKEKRFYINPHGSNKLAKGGSGDVLAGLVAGLLAQGYEDIDAAVNATLIHAKLASIYEGANFSLTPTDLIEAISKL